jgi:alditol oxidase
MDERATNWGRNVTFAATQVARPRSVLELRRLVADSDRVRALGTGHSFSRVADSSGTLVSVAGLSPAIEVGADRRSVTAGAGVRYGELAGHLQREGLALANLGSLAHISVSGACATGTHGSGDANRSLSAAVSALELVGADGEITVLRRGEEDFDGAVVALGCLGVVIRLTLDVVPSFTIRQYVYEDLPRDRLHEHFDVVFAAAYSVSLFTDWTAPRIDQVWLKRLDEAAAPPEQRWLGARLADRPRHPVRGMPTENCTPQLGLPGPWHERLPHFRLGFTPSVGEELQSEFLLPRRQAVSALAALDRIAGLVAPVLQISEIRTVAADRLWLSPSYGRDTVALHFTWIKDARAVAPVISAVEDALAPFDPRPHWGKLSGIGPNALTQSYERLPDFRELVRRHDPDGRFRNDFTDGRLGLER